MKRILDQLDAALSRAEHWIIAVFSVAALIIGTAQVVMRYVFNTGFHWTEAIFILFTIAAMLFAGSRAVRDDAHVKVDILPQLLPRPVQKILRVFRYVVSGALVSIFCWAGLQYVLFTHNMGIVSPTSGLPIWVIYTMVPVTMGAFGLRYLILLAREAGGEETGASEADHPISPGGRGT